MKKCWMLLVLALLLCGCGAEETFETVADDLVQPVMAAPRQIMVQLPENAVAPVLGQEGEQLYLCEGYEILVQTREAGDIGATIRALSGYEKDALTVMELRQENVTRYEFVWACVGEQGDRLGRAVVLDDGSYHYCLSVLRDAEGEESQIVWEPVFASFGLI